VGRGNAVAGRVVVVAVACAALLAPTRAAGQAVRLIPPVDGPISRHFEAPAGDYGPGHRGIDLAVARGSPVRAAASGVVRFAGPVAGVNAVSLDHGAGVVSTYTDLDAVWVRAGDRLDEGTWLGAAGTAHGRDDEGVHFGVKVDGRYVDPTTLLGPLDLSGALHLAPLDGGHPCARPARLRGRPPPPNDNVAVAVAGIASRTTEGWRPDLYADLLTERLGYPAERVYAFSYRGSEHERLHEGYERDDTYGPLEAAAERLAELMRRIRRVHPSASMDIVAHSQGGIVARLALERLARSWDARMPRVAHLVTLASPHAGAAGADALAAVRRRPLGGLALRALSEIARWAPIPRLDAPSITQMTSGSELLAALAREDIAFGARGLALAMPHDVLVTADRASMPHESHRILAPEGVWGHTSILRSEAARATIYSFLRDGPASCASAWDVAGPWVGRALGALVGLAADRWGTLGRAGRAFASALWRALLPGK
jgi:hypothetical protein